MIIHQTKCYTQKQYNDLGSQFITEELKDIINLKSKKVHWSTAKIETERVTQGVDFKGIVNKIEMTIVVKLTVEAE